MTKERQDSGYAFFDVDILTAQILTSAPHALGNALINCKIAADHSKISVSQRDEMDRKIYVSNLPPRTTDLDLLQIFKPFGALAKAYLVRNRADGSCKNFGFVIFQEKADLDQLLQDQPAIRFRQRRVMIKKAVDRQTQTFKKQNNSHNPIGQRARRQPRTEEIDSTKSKALLQTEYLNEAESNYEFNFPLPKSWERVRRQDQVRKSQAGTCHALTLKANLTSHSCINGISLHK